MKTEISADVSRSQESPGRANTCKHVFQRPFVPQQIFLKDMDKVVNQKKKPNPTTKYGPRKVQPQALEQGISWSWVVLMAIKVSVQQL